MRWIKPLRFSTTTRLAGMVGLAFLLAFAMVGGFAYLTVSSLLYQDAREVIRVDTEGLMELYRQGGRAALLDEVRQRVAHPDDPDALYAVIQRSSGQVLVGNVEKVPSRAADGWIRRQGGGDRELPVLMQQRTLDQDLRLVTGLRLRSESGFLAIGLHAALLAALLALVLGLLLGGLIARWVSRRLRRLEETAAQVHEGTLTSRVPLDGSGDAFELLALRFNRMLDRIGELLSGVREATDHIAHDLRTPLTRLRSRLESLRTDARVPGATLDAAIAEVDQLLQSSGALLRLARLEAQAPADAEPEIALEPLIRDAVELYEPMAAERGIGLPMTLDAVWTRGDADQLFQMLINLLDNAIKYSPAHGQVQVSLRREAGSARIEIADSGSGIPVEERERVFDRFQRLEKHRSSPGVGLGLSLVRAIVHRHRGHIRLEDQQPGLRVVVVVPGVR